MLFLMIPLGQLMLCCIIFHHRLEIAIFLDNSTIVAQDQLACLAWSFHMGSQIKPNVDDCFRPSRGENGLVVSFLTPSLHGFQASPLCLLEPFLSMLRSWL